MGSSVSVRQREINKCEFTLTCLAIADSSSFVLILALAQSSHSYPSLQCLAALQVLLMLVAWTHWWILLRLPCLHSMLSMRQQVSRVAQ